MQPEVLSPQRFRSLVMDEEIPLAHRALWAGLWDGEARVRDWLNVMVEGVDLDDGRVRVLEPVRSDTPEWVRLDRWSGWLVRRLVEGRRSGPLLAVGSIQVTERSAHFMASSRAGVDLYEFRAAGIAARAEHYEECLDVALSEGLPCRCDGIRVAEEASYAEPPDMANRENGFF